MSVTRRESATNNMPQCSRHAQYVKMPRRCLGVHPQGSCSGSWRRMDGGRARCLYYHRREDKGNSRTVLTAREPRCAMLPFNLREGSGMIPLGDNNELSNDVPRVPNILIPNPPPSIRCSSHHNTFISSVHGAWSSMGKHELAQACDRRASIFGGET